MSNQVKTYFSQAHEHQRLASMGSMEYAIMLDGNITGGQLSLIESTAGHGEATPVHVHGHDDEAILVLHGQLTIFVGDEEPHVLTPGGIAYLPRKIPHAVRCDIQSRMLIINTPGGHQEVVFRGAGWDLKEPKPQGWQASVQSLRAAGIEAGNDVVGPPPGIHDEKIIVAGLPGLAPQ
jgi:quercetin dioxygenase-like cupin family protein